MLTTALPGTNTNTLSSTTMITKVTSTVTTPNECNDSATIAAATVVPTIAAITLLIIVVLTVIYCRKRQTALINLTKHHKESVENSYTSSKHSHESGSKSPDPEYDVIKINPSTDKLEAHSVKTKSDILCQAYSSVQSNVLKHEEDWDCGPMYSSVDTNTGGPHKIGDFTVNEVNADDITDKIIPSSSNSQSIAADTEDNSVKLHIYAKVDVKKKKANRDHKNEIEDSDEGSIPPPVPPQTTEMLYVTIKHENDTKK